MIKHSVLLLTGCTGRFGTEFVRMYSDRYTIVGVSRTPPETIVPELDYLNVDLVEDPRRAIDYVLERYGRLDVLVNNAACLDVDRALKTGRKVSFADQMQINAIVPFELIRYAFLQFWRQAGRDENETYGRNIVNLGSILNVRQPGGDFALDYGFACYAATKHALGGLTSYLRDELEPHGVRINLLAPGGFPSEQPTELVCKACAELIASTYNGTVTTIDFGEVRTLQCETEFAGAQLTGRRIEAADVSDATMDVIQNKSKRIDAFPYRHIVLDDFFRDDVHAEISEAFEALLSQGTSEVFCRSRLSMFPGYDAYCWVFEPEVQFPLDIFYSSEWRDHWKSVFGIPLTGEVVVEFHHHRPGSKEDIWHDDFNHAYFLERARLANGINPWNFQCNYMDPAVSQLPDDAEVLERDRAVAFIYYFGRDAYQPGDGGHTGIGAYDPACREVQLWRAVEPQPNRLLAFEISDRSHHKFLTNHRRVRNTIIGWFHTTRDYTLARHGYEAKVWSKGDIAGGKRSPEGVPLDQVVYQ